MKRALQFARLAASNLDSDVREDIANQEGIKLRDVPMRGYWNYLQGLIYETLRWDGYGEFWEADHILEFSKGGEHILSNLQTLCLHCHKDKTARVFHHRKNSAAKQSRLF